MRLAHFSGDTVNYGIMSDKYLFVSVPLYKINSANFINYIEICVSSYSSRSLSISINISRQITAGMKSIFPGLLHYYVFINQTGRCLVARGEYLNVSNSNNTYIALISKVRRTTLQNWKEEKVYIHTYSVSVENFHDAFNTNFLSTVYSFYCNFFHIFN